MCQRVVCASIGALGEFDPTLFGAGTDGITANIDLVGDTSAQDGAIHSRRIYGIQTDGCRGQSQTIITIKAGAAIPQALGQITFTFETLVSSTAITEATIGCSSQAPTTP